jgi:low temperature requirement protein LtrA
MSDHTGEQARTRRWAIPMRSRSPDEAHRASTPLELLFDLVFVVAVAQAASALHHGLAEGQAASSIVSFAMVFFAIWWAWMNFTWFASAYDTDDVPYRLAVFVQLTGALILAAGVPQAFEEHDFGIVTAGYAVMRLALVTQWLRAARSEAHRRATPYRYAIGISVLQVGWLMLLFVPAAWQPIGFALLVAAELAVPIWAERAAGTTWHPGRIAERYGLFTIIVLGESILSAALAMQSAIQTGDVSGELAPIIAGGLLIVLSMWWLYFDQPAHDLLTSTRTAFVWGYGHLLIFASAAAVGAGLAVSIDRATHHAEIGALGAGAAVAVPVAIYLASLWALHQRPRAASLAQAIFPPVVALLVLLTPPSGQAVLATGLLLAALLAVKLVSRHRAGA